eukprot:TRINITY_DN23149_c0_g1_i6.p2 TRINITY_DN23149_c0_g1~~TRINITY_DN23149_c0_g1_i6.p2  ORF type:complete len:228 (+),score=28.43 TRINITY_DN23149_c0_g1_i6:271-954(+)
MSLYDVDNAFVALLQKGNEKQKQQAQIQRVENIEQEDEGDKEQSIFQESSEKCERQDLEELEQQLFGSGVAARVMSWADELEEYENDHPNMYYSHCDDSEVHSFHDQFEARSSLNGSSPTNFTDRITSLSDLARQLSSLSSLEVSQGANFLRGSSPTSHYGYSVEIQDGEYCEYGEWIQAKNQRLLYSSNSLQLLDNNAQNNDGQAKKKSRRRKRGGRRTRKKIYHL